MLGSSELVAFVGTTDAARARTFYVDVLGLEHVEASRYADVYRAGNATVRVARVDAVAAAPYTVLGFVVDDAAAAVDALAARGVETVRYPQQGQDARGIWRAPSGARVAWFNDPDGNLLSLTER